MSLISSYCSMEKKSSLRTEEIFFAGGCLWGVQEFLRHLPGVASTEAGRANGSTAGLKKHQGEYDGYAECVRTIFHPDRVSVRQLMGYFFEIIDPYSLNVQVDKSNPFNPNRPTVSVYGRARTGEKNTGQVSTVTIPRTWTKPEHSSHRGRTRRASWWRCRP